MSVHVRVYIARARGAHGRPARPRVGGGRVRFDTSREWSTCIKKDAESLYTTLLSLPREQSTPVFGNQPALQSSESATMTARQAILKTAQPSHYLVLFEIDECVSIIQRKHLLDPPIPSIGDVCRVQWSGEEYSSKLLAMGDEAAVKKAEVDYLTALDDAENNEPARKKPKPATKTTKSKATSGKTPNRRKNIERGQKKATDFVLCIGSPAKAAPPPPQPLPPPPPASVSGPLPTESASSLLPPLSPQPFRDITNTCTSSNLDIDISFSSSSDSGESDVIIADTIPKKVNILPV